MQCDILLASKGPPWSVCPREGYQKKKRREGERRERDFPRFISSGALPPALSAEAHPPPQLHQLARIISHAGHCRMLKQPQRAAAADV